MYVFQSIAHIDTIGHLYQSSRDFTYLKVSDEFIRKTLPWIEGMGFKVPPFYGDNGVGAHVTVIKNSEKTQERRILLEHEKQISFKLSKFQIVEPQNWHSVIKAAIVTLESIPFLEKYR